ncbi:hypothetical protein T10_1320, partial [Trichinella papuae]
MPIRTRGNGLHHGPSRDCSSSLDMVSQTVIYMAGIVKQSFSLTSFLSRSVYNKEKWTYLKVMAIFHRNNHGEPCWIDEHLDYKEKPSVPSAMKRLLPPPLNRQSLASSWFLSGREGPYTKIRQSASPDFLNNVKTLCCGSRNQNILVFATGSNIILLAKRKTRGMDGRLKIVAQWYQQRLSIHAFVACNLMSAVYSLCTDKDIGTYRFIFQVLINKAAGLRVNLQAQTIICDFVITIVQQRSCSTKNV